MIAPHGADPPVIILNKMDPPVFLVERQEVIQFILANRKEFKKSECVLLVVCDKIGLRWRGHYILNDEKM